MRISRHIFICLFGFMVGFGSTSLADTLQLEIHSAPLPLPAMNYRLFPSAAEQTPGNAATVYLMAFAAAGDITADNSYDNLKSARLKNFPVNDAQQFLGRHRSVVEQLLLAGRREDCKWDPPLRGQGFNIDLSYLSRAQVMIDLLRIKAHLELTRRQYEPAIETLQSAFALAHHLNQPPALQAVVAAGLESILLEDVRNLICQSGCPNLYWALANLPAADEQRRRVTETDSLLFLFPRLKDPRQLSAAESRQVLGSLSQIMQSSERGQWDMNLLVAVVRAYPEAKEYLKVNGLTASEIEATPANSAVLSFFVADYRRRAEQLEKWAGLPLWQACDGIERAIVELDAPQQNINPLLSVLPWHNELLQFALVERQRAMLQIIEAIRASAHTSGGALPPSLASMSIQTPIPLDPMTGGSFEYSVSANTATLRAPAAPRLPQVSQTTYLITISRQ